MVDKTRILIVDDHSAVVEGIKSILDMEMDFEVVGTAADGVEAIKMTKSLKPQIVIMDIAMPHMDGIDATEQIKKANPATRVLIYSMTASREHVTALFRKSVDGYVLKEEPLSELLMAAKTLSRGASFFSKAVKDIISDHMVNLEFEKEEGSHARRNGFVSLSAREKEVFLLLADGLSVKKIADRLCISPKTVESHKYNIMEKLNVDTLAGITKIAVKKKLIDL